MAEMKGRVLCVDDEPNIVRSLQWLLQKDFDVLTAGSGQDALALVRQQDFDVVISDQRMPLMSGVDLLREVKKVSPRSIRILLTGYSDLQSILSSVNESEVYRFINKPWNISGLPNVVEQAVIVSRTQAVESPEPQLAGDAPVAASTGIVLLIDDNPKMLDVMTQAVGPGLTLLHAANLAEAVGILNEHPVCVIVSEIKVASLDATRLIRLMKQKRPEIVTIMLSAQSDADTVTTLINQGQIYRFVPKPVQPGYLRMVMHSALGKHARLMATPGLAKRHSVEATAAGTLESLAADVRKVAHKLARPDDKETSEGMIARVGASFKRLFGG